jgi:cysteine dioxygenase
MNLTDIVLKLKKIENFDNYDELYNLIYDYNSDDYKEFIDYSPIHYNKIFLHSCKKFDLVLICWKRGQSSQIHDHPDYCCILKLLEGTLIEEEFKNNTDNLKMYETNILKNGTISNKKQNEIVHRIIPIEDSVSLHLYIPGHYKPNLYINKKIEL